MNESYDCIVLGTGVKECILSGLLSVDKRKVLHMDRNDYYGAETASLDLDRLYKLARETGKPDPALGRGRSYHIDQCPKFIMANGNMVKMLLSTQVTKYIQFKCVEGSYVYKGESIHEVPVTATQFAGTSLMGMFQKRRFKNFLEWVYKLNPNDKSTWGKLDLKKVTMDEVYEYWKCDENTQTLTGHAIALYTNDKYKKNPFQTLACLERIKLYADSLARFQKSPYIYPCYGLSTVPEGFARLASLHGGTYMLRHPVKRIHYDDKGQACAVETSEGIAKLNPGGKIIGDPSYFMDTVNSKSPKVKKVGRVARWLCILDQPVPNTSNKNSCQIIMPASELNRQFDIYVSVMSSDLSVAPKGKYVAMISAQVETDKPKDELLAAYKLLGPVRKEFFFVNDIYMPCNDPRVDNIFITSSMDAQTHFENATREVQAIYKLLTGKDVDLSARPEDATKTDE